VLATKVDKSDCDEPGREEAVDRASLSTLLKKPDFFFRNGGDCSGEIVSWSSSESLPSFEGPVMGENNGRGMATDESAESGADTFSEEETLPTVCLRRGTKARPDTA
jgi:hypothetical protein